MKTQIYNNMKKEYQTIVPNHRKEISNNLIYCSNHLNDYYIEHGKTWYLETNRLAKNIHEFYGILDVDKIAQLIAIMSSNMEWTRNLIEVHNICNIVRKGIKLDIEKHRIFQSKANYTKALPLFEGKDVFKTRNKAKKTYSFYHNIMLDNSYITIDTHHIKCLVLNTEDWKAKISNVGIYEDLEAITKKVSIPYLEKYNINYYEYQASLWLLIKDRYKDIKHGIKKVPTKIYSSEYRKAKKLKYKNMEIA